MKIGQETVKISDCALVCTDSHCTISTAC